MAEVTGPEPRTAANAAPNTTRLRIRYLIAGLVLGGLWFIHGGEPVWMHALRMLVIMVIVLPMVKIVLRRRHGAQTGPRIAYARFIAAKLTLLAIAAGMQWVLSEWTVVAGTIVAAGLVVIVCLLGPVLRPHIIREARPDARSNGLVTSGSHQAGHTPRQSATSFLRHRPPS